jgi:hypothetical protein
MSDDVYLVSTANRVVLKRSEMDVRDSGGTKRSLTVLLLGPRLDGSWPNYVAELQVDGNILFRVDVTALLGALTPDPVVPS